MPQAIDFINIIVTSLQNETIYQPLSSIKMNYLYCFSIVFFFFISSTFSQSDLKNELEATRISSSIKIDGILNESDWQTAKVANQFTDEKPIPNIISTNKTEVKILYDDASIYVSAVLHEVSKDSILRQLCLRDEGSQRFRGPFGNTNTDWFAIGFDNYMDGVNGLFFCVSAAGIQYDMKLSSQGWDKNWDSVWKSDVTLHDDKWIIEMEIPFSALRFPSAEEQKWHVNFSRVVRRQRSQSWWNPIDPAVDGLLNQFGILKGIKNIKSPIRLQATPYVAATVDHYREKNGDPSSKTGRNIAGGMDIKYGLNDAFTLDMTLIPNFGDVVQDDQVLNLSAFEIRFDENRPFFTEGTELFNKGRLFYSRRIGGRPLNFYDAEDDLNENEKIDSNPIETPLINALKLSGRTNNGLGIGVFNAITQKAHAIIVDTLSGNKREFQTNPNTNYNVIVFDQNLKNNSFVSLINANTMRFGDDYDANSTAVVFGVNNKKRTVNIQGSGKLSQIYTKNIAEGGIDTDLGHAYGLEVSKTGGKLNYGAFYNVESDTYNPNDLGFLYNNNERSMGTFMNFNQYEPFGKFNNAGLNVSLYYSMLYAPSYYSNFGVNINNYYVRKTFFAFGYSLNFSPVRQRDYFEPRQDDNFESYLDIPQYFSLNSWLSSDYRKKFAYDFRFEFAQANQKGRYDIEMRLSPRFRFNDKLFAIWSTNYEIKNNNVGFADYDNNDESVVGIRDITTIVNTLSANYIFNRNMGVTLEARHYWSKVNYDSHHLLNNKGRLLPSDYSGNTDFSFNAFTIDMVYKWRFAPGSDLVLVWKNAIFNSDDENTDINYFQNFKLFGAAPQTNTITLKVLYFLDYYTLKNKLKKKKTNL